MAIKEPLVAEIAYRTWCINEMGMDAMFLFEGDEKALLIDTGTGMTDIRKTINRLTQKPLLVALTHGHVDHAGGMNQFSEVYLHPDDFCMAEQVSTEQRKGYVKSMEAFNDNVFCLSTEFITEPVKIAKMLPLTEGQTIHLGGREIEVYETPGHTPGGLSFLDKKERILISGDACNGNTLIATNKPGTEKTGIKELLYTAKKLKSLEEYYDRHYNGHIGYGGRIEFTSQPQILVEDCISLCEGLISRAIKGEEDNTNAFTGSCLVAKKGTLKILYRNDQL